MTVSGSARAHGHRLEPHAADVIVEAWGATVASCLEQAVLGMVEAFADVGTAAPIQDVPVDLVADDRGELLVALLEEVIFLVEVGGRVPVAAHLEIDDTGHLVGGLGTVPAGAVDTTGALPKGVSRSGLVVEWVDDEWRARAVVDV
jgi:SHS2 domain-containing protein